MKKPKVLKVEWLLTRKCNLRCTYCKIVDSSTLGGPELSYEEVIEGVNRIHTDFPKAPIIFFGGEPTILNWLPDLVSHCENIGVKYAVISNSIRIVQDEEYFMKLVHAGISNWSVSIDSLAAAKGLEIGYTSDAFRKSQAGIVALKKFREYGVRDLVACITVTQSNIQELPEIIELLTKNGIWSITTPLQLGKAGYEYSSDNVFNFNQSSITSLIPTNYRRVVEKLREMAESGKYLMHNDPKYYTLWFSDSFRKQNWKCEDKFNLTIDADGSFKRCVDIKGGLNILNIKDVNWKDYLRALDVPFHCDGCFWDPAIETCLRGREWDFAQALDSFRHEMTEEQIQKLLPEAQRWFK